ncbi:hypothetical protein [Pontibacter virosus]|uniref:Uncharacterized protein n=1 Tax=Pontibacter virosus TaxID=1765052 RepID=A0A2U1AWY2_9BACT|nr:hypothetical protein [Pontibacter virosus]PVY40944.1 hypothetical protein C8E01_106286 [Pontibacter virosus]
MYKGEPSEGIEFYNLLFKSDDFNAELGKVALAAGRLEAELMRFLYRNGVKEKVVGSTLGKLVDLGNKHKLFDKNLAIALDITRKQRNYLTHNIYALLTELIDETILKRSNLLDSDVHTYEERAWQLRGNLVALADIISEK